MHLTPPTTVKYHAPKAVEKVETWISNKIQEETRPSDRSLSGAVASALRGRGVGGFSYIKGQTCLSEILKKRKPKRSVTILKQVHNT